MSELRTLHVSTPGAEVRKCGEMLQVWVEGRRKLTVRLYDLEVVHLYARAHLTAAALQACMSHGVRVAWFAGQRLVARAEPEAPSHVLTRIAQVDRLRDKEYTLVFVRHLVEAKLRSQRAVLLRWRLARSEPTLVKSLDCAAQLLEQGLGALAESPSVDTLRGLEGMAAVNHFAGVAAVLDPSWQFRGRIAHPPRDAVNAILSFGYVVLCNELAGLIQAVGLDPAIGVLHGLRSGRDSLALDVVEPFRAPIIDALVVPLLNRGMVRPEHFEPEPHGVVHLSAEGRKVFLRNYELWMRAPYRGRAIFGGLPGQGTASDCWRHALRAQALLVRNAIIHRVLPEWLWSQQSGPEAGLEFAERRKARAPAQSKRAQRKAKVDKKKSDGDSAGDDPE